MRKFSLVLIIPAVVVLSASCGQDTTFKEHSAAVQSPDGGTDGGTSDGSTIGTCERYGGECYCPDCADPGSYRAPASSWISVGDTPQHMCNWLADCKASQPWLLDVAMTMCPVDSVTTALGAHGTQADYVAVSNRCENVGAGTCAEKIECVREYVRDNLETPDWDCTEWSLAMRDMLPALNDMYATFAMGWCVNFYEPDNWLRVGHGWTRVSCKQMMNGRPAWLNFHVDGTWEAYCYVP